MFSEEERKKRRKESWKRYYDANKKKLNKLTVQYRIDNPETYKEYNKNYNASRKELKKQLYIDNKESIQNSHKEYRQNNKIKVKMSTKRYDYKRKYGMTVEQYDDMFNKQEGKCAVCGTHQSELKLALAVDHDHITKKVRGLLCGKCNRGIGYLNDDVAMLENAIEYLKTNL